MGKATGGIVGSTEVRVTVRASGHEFAYGSRIVGTPLCNNTQTESHGVCNDTSNWRARANAKPYTVYSNKSESFCI